MIGFQAAGTGLLSLDVIIDKKKFEIIAKTAGGSTGNVLSILSFMGWDSYPISYIGTDMASDLILEDLERWGVKSNYIFRLSDVKTPIIIENLLDGSNGKDHEFKFKCPICNARLPKNRIIPKDIFNKIKKEIPHSDVFYIDRLSITGVEMAKIQKKQGSIIFFEPHKVSKIRLFKEILKLADIVKYSGDSIDNIPFKRNPVLEIKTLGHEGVSFAFNQDSYMHPNFMTLSSYKIGEIIDTAGAGDWLSAGIIHKIITTKKKLDNQTEEQIIKAINFGQSLAALNCMFIGPRGMMYHLDYYKIVDYSTNTLKRRSIKLQLNGNVKVKNYMKNICNDCNSISPS